MFTLQELAAIVDLCKAVGGHDGLLKKIQEQMVCVNFKGTVFVDVPDKAALGDDDAGWTNVFTADSVPEAVAWINEHIGGCDEFGNVNLLTLGEKDDEDCPHGNIMSYTEDGVKYYGCRDCSEIFDAMPGTCILEDLVKGDE